MQTAMTHRLAAAALEKPPALGRASRTKLDMFVSIGTHDFGNARGDIDLLVDVEDLSLTGQADLYFGLHDVLQALSRSKLNLSTRRSTENPHPSRSIEATRRQLYVAP